MHEFNIWESEGVTPLLRARHWAGFYCAKCSHSSPNVSQSSHTNFATLVLAYQAEAANGVELANLRGLNEHTILFLIIAVYFSFR